jgi:hypothetical protein
VGIATPAMDCEAPLRLGVLYSANLCNIRIQQPLGGHRQVPSSAYLSCLIAP